MIATSGLAQRADLPIPVWLFSIAAALVLVVSFAALALLWRTPRLEGASGRDGPRVRVGAALDVVAGAAGVALFALVVAAGLTGSPTAQDNLAPTFVYVVVWVGLVPVSLLFGDVFAALSPWRSFARAAAWTAARTGRPPAPPRPYPRRLGRWPAAAGILSFGWLELVCARGTDPHLLALLAVAYAAAQLAGMAWFGIATWTARADAFGVVFGLFGALAPLHRRGAWLTAGAPLRGANAGEPPGTIAVLAALIGATSFDGLQTTALWSGDLRPALRDVAATLGSGPAGADTWASTVGLAGMTAFVALLYLLGAAAVRLSAATPDRVLAVGRRFVPSLIPIAAAYAVAHGLTLLLFQGQAVPALASDPLGLGSDLLGTAAWRPDFGVVGDAAIWYLQVAAVVVGHVAALALAHDRSLVAFAGARHPVRAQGWLLAVMVAFTTLALGLLASTNA